MSFLTCQFESRATVKTAFALAYLRRLCHHFAHKVPVTVNDRKGRIDLPFGICRIDTDEQFLFFHLETDDRSHVELAEEMISDHLLRMADRDNPVVNWTRNPLKVEVQSTC